MDDDQQRGGAAGARPPGMDRSISPSLLLLTDAGAERSPIASRRAPAPRPKQASRATEPRRSLVEKGEAQPWAASDACDLRVDPTARA
jgi:hypothetical protein